MVALDESRFGFREGCISVFPSAGWMRGRSFLHEGEGCRRHRVALRGDAAWFKSTFLALIGS